MIVGCAWFLHANYHITHRLAAQFHWWNAYLNINHRIQESTDQWHCHSQTIKLYSAKMVHIYYQDINFIQRVVSCQLPAVDHQIKWDTKHGAWSDDPRLETWRLHRSCYCYEDKFIIYPFIMRWKWKIIFVKYKNEE